MRPAFCPRLINGPFDDPGLFIPFSFKKRALIFDLGDLSALSTRDILKISHGFITHTHMDHFVGFDRVLRLLLGRDKQLHLFGPKGFIKNVEGKLAGYAWNLVQHYTNRFALHITEVHPARLKQRQYLCHHGFAPTQEAVEKPFNDILHEEAALSISAAILDHNIPCLAFSIKERFHVNIKKDCVVDLGLAIGPWLTDFKQALFSRQDPQSEFVVEFGTNRGQKRKFILGELTDRIAIITPGQKVTYIADVGYSPSNVEKIVALASDADHLFIEAAFLEAERDIARQKYHLTAQQAGLIAAKASAKQFTIFHFSPRYRGQEGLLREEARKAYEGVSV